MKQVVATVHPAESETLCAALYAAGVRDLSLVEVSQYHPNRQPDEIYKGVRYPAPRLARIRLELRLEDAAIDAAVALIFKTAGVEHVEILALARVKRSASGRSAEGVTRTASSPQVVMAPLG